MGDPPHESAAAAVDSIAVGGDALFQQVYARLKAMAGKRLSKQRDASLQTTALVHELYLRMRGGVRLAFEHEARFFTYAARAMRHVLSDRARDRLRQCAGGDWVRVSLSVLDRVSIDSAEQALSLENAVQLLERTDARAAAVVELTYFAGLTLEDTAKILGVARRTVDRDWRFAKAFLKAELA